MGKLEVSSMHGSNVVNVEYDDSIGCRISGMNEQSSDRGFLLSIFVMDNYVNGFSLGFLS